LKYVHTNIISEDWKKLSEFYIKVFDCKIVPPIRKQSGTWLSKGTGLDNASLEGVHLLLPGFGSDGPTLEIYSYEDTKKRNPVNPNNCGFTHLAFEVEDVSKTLKKILENGGARQGELVEKKIEGKGFLTFTYARDPDGNLIEIQRWD
jgi:catechol 2,3-dioxygenase-like lactoylglutathione lyase family enzyme